MKKVLLVIDFIKGIVEGKGSCSTYLSEHPELIVNTVFLMRMARENNIPIYHIRLAFDPEYAYLPKYAPSAKVIKENLRFQIGSEAVEFISSIQINDEDKIINKSYGDIFHGNDLLDELREAGVEQVIMVGVATDNAILNSANTAILNNLFVTIVRDACGAPTEEAHEAALKIIKGRTASEIISTQDLINP